jgi:hypothetical protein
VVDLVGTLDRRDTGKPQRPFDFPFERAAFEVPFGENRQGLETRFHSIYPISIGLEAFLVCCRRLFDCDRASLLLISFTKLITFVQNEEGKFRRTADAEM